jgi:8-oxo-dGTP pyrophosphatase MutT (NUDIX family)
MFSWDALEADVRRVLDGGAPGPEAQLPMAPRPRPGWAPGRIPSGSRPGAALVLLYARDELPLLLLTVRAKHLPSHRGQVSFPGGAVEPGESAVEAALREVAEEVGVDPDLVRVAGRLTPLHIPASGFVLDPVVGFTSGALALRAAPGEVERILEVPLADVADPTRQRVEVRELRGQPWQVPYFDLAGEKVWGATAMVLCELMAVLGVACDPWKESSE